MTDERRKNGIRFLVLIMLILAIGLTACSEDPTPTPGSAPSVTPAPTPQAVSTVSTTPTRSPAPTPYPTPEPTQTPGRPLPKATPTPMLTPPGPPPPVADLLVTIDGDTRWLELYDTLGQHEQDCIRDSLGAGLLSMVKGEPVSISAFEWTQEWQVLVFNCLDPETGRAILLFDMVAGFFEDGLPSVSEMDCLTGVAADTDAAAVIAGLLPDSGDLIPMGEFWAGFVKCIPERFIAENLGFVDGMKFLDDQATECLHEAIAALDGKAIASALRDETAPDSESDGLFGDFENCLIHLWSDSNGEAEVNIDDDHSNEIEGATSVNVGESAPGSVDYETDRDFFVIETKEGVTYQFEVLSGTLKEPGVSLFNAEFQLLADSGEYVGSAPQLVWQAPVSGPFYVAVWGWDLGTTPSRWRSPITSMLTTTTPTPGEGPPS